MAIANINKTNGIVTISTPTAKTESARIKLYMLFIKRNKKHALNNNVAISTCLGFIGFLYCII